MGTKLDFINEAFSRMRISGLTRQPSGSDIGLAVSRLENMAAEWEARNICTGYNFEDSPNTGTPHNVPRQYWSAYETNLAMRLLADFGKEPMPSLVKEARGAFSAMSAATARVTPVQYPNRMPVGSGNSLRHNRFQNYYRKVESAPNECATNIMLEGEVDVFVEHFDSALGNLETVSSYTITSSDSSSLAISSDSLSTPDVTYTVTANDAGVYTVTIEATTSDSRVIIRKVNFVVRKS